MSRRVLVVDDEKLIVKGIRFSLEQDGYDVDCAYDGEEALKLAKENAYDIILLDVMLPKYDGFEVCQQIREYSDVPIIMLTAKGDDMDKILGLDYGADDYITKPFGVSELISRVKAVLRRTDGAAPNNYSVGGISLDDGRRLVCAEGRQCALTYTEYELLKALVSNCGMVLSREKLMVLVWGTDFAGESRTVDVHVKTLRQKLGSCGDLIKTVRNVGYKIEMQ